MEGSLVRFLVTNALISTRYYPYFRVMMGVVMAPRGVVEPRSEGDPVLR